MVDNVVFGNRLSVEVLIGEIAVPEDAEVGVAGDVAAVDKIEPFALAGVGSVAVKLPVLCSGLGGVEIQA